MRYLWVVVILSAGAFGQNAYGPDYLNLHCTTPDPLAQTLFNIQPRPGLVPDRSANGNIIFYCDSSTGTFKASFDGGPYTTFAKFTVDVRDTASNFDCTGNTAMDTPMQTIASNAHIVIPLGCVIKLASPHTYTQAFEFKQGGQLKPNTGTLITLTGPIIAGSYQIFSNAFATQGGIDFTGNTNTFDVLPEWWGAGINASAATNTTALQAAIYGAFGCNVSPITTCRTNASNTSFYNKRLFLAGSYTISGELHWYHTLGAVMEGSERLSSGIIQSGVNTRIIDGQSNAYMVFRDLGLSATSSQDINHPLVDLNFDNSQGSDLRPQFIDFYSVNFNGGQVAKIGVRIAAAGGGAQGSNINFFDPLAENFTEAAYMIGAGSNCVPTQVATNAIQVSWYGGDMQNNHAFGVEDFGGTNMLWDGGTAENGANVALGGIQQTGADFCANNLNNAGGPFTIKHTRSESSYFLFPLGGAGASGPWNLIDVVTLDDISSHVANSGTTLNDLYEGETSCGHGFWYKITTAGTLSGLGSRGSPLTATGGSATTIVDSVGGFTVNAWTGFVVCTLSPANTPPEYCIITSNTANTFTCSGGFLTDFPTVGTANPVNGTLYDIQPAWGGATVTSGGATLTRDDTTYSNLNLVLDAFFPGKRVSLAQTAVVENMQLTRADWAQVGTFPEAQVVAARVSVLVGSPPTTGTGNGAISLNPFYERTWTLSRNGVTEPSLLNRSEFGTRVLHWFSGQSTGGSTVTDAYIGIDPLVPLSSSTAGHGDFFIMNNSASTQIKWTFNFDGSASFPAPVTSTGSAATLTGTGACATTSTQAGGNFAGNVTCTGATAASTLIITPGTTAPHGLACSASDITHTLAGSQSAVSATACTMTFTSVTANDVLTFGVLAY